MEKREGSISFLYKQVGDKRGSYIFSIATAILSVLFEIVPYALTGAIICKLIEGEKDLWVYGNLCLFSILFYAIKIFFHTISTNASHKATFQILANIRKKCSEKLSRMPLGDVNSRPAGALKSTLVERIDSIEVTLAHIVPEFTSNLIPPVIILIFIFIMSWQMGLASLVSIIIGIACMMGMFIGYEKYYKRTLEATKTLNDTSVEYINGIEVIKVFGKTESSYKKFSDAAVDCADSYVSWMRRSNVFFTIGMVFMPATMIAILPVGGILYMNGLLTLKDLIIIILFAIALVEPLIRVASYNDDLRNVDTIVDDVRDILDAPELARPEAMKDGLSIKDSSISLKDVHFAYQRDEVLHGVSVDIKSGEYVALVGPSGSGKSTIAKLISSMWDVSSGSISLGGVNIKDIPLNMYMNMIAYVSQDTYLFNQSIMDNLKMGSNKEISDEEVIEICKESGVHEFIMGLDDGYQTVVGSGGCHLSGGEKQRISIARAMIKNSPIVILDEATSYADPENEAIIQDSVSKLINGKTLIVIAHRLSTIKNADRIIVVNNGNIDAIGKHEELLNSCDLYKRMWDAHISVRDKKEEDYA